MTTKMTTTPTKETTEKQQQQQQLTTPPRPTRQLTVPPTPVKPKMPPRCGGKIPYGSKAYYGAKRSGGKSMQWKRPMRAEITRPALRRLAQRAKIRRMSEPIYDITREELDRFLVNVIGKAFEVTDGGKRKTVSVTDVLHSLSLIGNTMYS